jgi:ribosomal protein L7/L12
MLNGRVSVSTDDLDLILRSVPPSISVSTENWEAYRRLVAAVECKMVSEKRPVLYTGWGHDKINVIKAIRGALDIGLKEAKDFSELPTIVGPVNLRERINLPTMNLALADGDVIRLARAMREAGATITFKE